MSKIEKYSLIIAVVTLFLDLAILGGDFLWGVLKPIGAVALVMFLLVYLFGKETEEFDKEHEANVLLYEKANKAGGRSGKH